MGCNEQHQQVFVPLKSLVPMIDPNDIIIDGWDINDAPMDVAMERACVFDHALQQKLRPLMKGMKPMKSIYYPSFIAANQSDRANNVYEGNHASTAHLEAIRRDIVQFKEENDLDKVIVIWTANTERFSEIITGVHDTARNLLDAINRGHTEIAPSQIFAVASILEGCAFVNGSPQNTFCPAIIEMARCVCSCFPLIEHRVMTEVLMISKRGVFIGGDDFKSGQTKIKSALVDFLVSSGSRRILYLFNEYGADYEMDIIRH